MKNFIFPIIVFLTAIMLALFGITEIAASHLYEGIPLVVSAVIVSVCAIAMVKKPNYNGKLDMKGAKTLFGFLLMVVLDFLMVTQTLSSFIEGKWIWGIINTIFAILFIILTLIVYRIELDIKMSINRPDEEEELNTHNTDESI